MDFLSTEKLSELLTQSARLHHHLCPRQVLGARMGMVAGRSLALELPQRDKRLFVFVETDGCAADGVSVSTGSWIGRRTMRVVDFGKVAATFVDTESGDALRIHPHPLARRRAVEAYPSALSSWHAQLEGYQTLPDEELLVVEAVELLVDLEAIISRPGLRTVCHNCREEIFNQREVRVDERALCQACAGGIYYRAGEAVTPCGEIRPALP